MNPRTTALLCAWALGLAATLGVAASHAQGVARVPAPAPTQLPSGGQVVAGQAQITQNAAAMTVQQSTLRAVIDWQQFNVGSQAQVRFDQPSAAAVTLNRVVGADPSQIMGRISAPGQVFISNPQGVLFGAGASVDVGGLVATTMGIGTADFMAGQSRFDRNGSTAGVVNQGRLTADPQGYIALLAPEVRNEGVITARAGAAVLAAGEAITLNFGTPGRLDSITVTPAQIATLVENRRAVLVEGGQIIIAARSAEQLRGSVVNSGELNATSLVRRGGKIMLEGDDITLTDGSRIEARGTSAAGAGGGTVLVGGDWQGSGDMNQATRVNMAESALIDVSATDRGDGGKAVLWADVHDPASLTAVHGRILARGGSAGGNGGQVETSAHTLDTDGARVDAGAFGGTGGLWLIDPADTTITQSIANGYAATLNTGTSVLNDVAGSIAWTSGVTLNKTAGGAASLTLRTGGGDNRGIDLTGATIGSTSGPLNLVLWTRYNSLGNSGKVTITDTTVNSNGGSVWVGGGSATTWNGLTVGDERAATWTADEQGVMVRNSSISTGAGSISMAGMSYATGVTTGVRNYGVMIDSGSSLATTSGSLSLSGDLLGRYNTGGGLWIGSSPIAPVAGSVGITSGSGAISLTGTGQDQAGSGSGYRHAMILITNQAGDNVTVRSGSGAITLSGNATFGAGGDFTSDTSGIQLQTGSATAPIQVVSTSGAITLSGQNTQQASQSENALRFTASDAAGNIRIGYDGSSPYSGNILIQGDSILQRTQQPGAGSLAVQTTGGLVIAPVGASFTALRADASSTLTFDNDWNFGSTLGGFTLGKAGNTAGLTLGNALTTAGPISLYGGSVTLNANLTSALAGAAILVKASGNIVTNASRTLQTNGGAITLWSDSDANGGYIWLNQNATLDSRTQADRTAGTHTTGGGKVTLAGGADDGSGAPAGYAMGDSGNTDRGGVNFGDQTASGHNSNTQILSGGGDVLIRGKSSNGLMGINWVDSGTLNAGSTGIVSLEGINTVSGHGIEFAAFGGAGNSTTIRSGGGSSSTPAITFTGSGTGSGFNGIQSGRPLTVLATGAGGITVNGTASSGWGYTGPLDFLAASGAIAINGGSGGIVSSSGGTLGKKAATPVTASSSNVTLTGDRVSLSGATTIDTSGTLTVQPSSASFSSALTWPLSNLSLGSSLSGLTVGKPGNLADITVGSTQTVAGPISIYGQGLTLNADLISTLAGAPILLKAASAIVSNNTRTFQTNGGAITLWADSDNSGQGFILLNPAASPQSTTLDSRTAADRTAGTHTTGGGKITLAGGADDGTGAPAGYAVSTSSTSDRGGVNFGDGITGGHNNNTLVYSGGGDVVVRGKSGTGTMGINWVDSGTINAGSTGLINLNGVNTSTGHGIEFGAYAVSGSSIVLRSGGGTSSTPAILISGTTGSTTANGAQATRLTGLATGAGGISITGTTANTSGYGYTGPLDFLAASGPIGIDGGSRGINSNGGTLGRKAATAVTASSSNVTLTGGTLNIGSATTIDTTGTVTLQPSATSFASAQTLGSNLTITGGVSGLTFGKPGNTADLTVASAQTIAGPISVYGGTVTLNAPLVETSSADSTLLLQAMTDIVVNGSNITSTTGKLNMVFITDWDSNNGGAIYVNGGTTPVAFTTRGGHVWLGGDGYAPAYSTTTWNGLTVGTGAATSFGTNYVQEGVNLKGTTITTAGGDVYVAGTNNRYNSGENRYGVVLQQGAAINSGSGNITLQGTLVQQTGTLSTYPVLFGVALDNASLQTTTGNIAVTGTEGATSGSMNAGGYGVRLFNSTARTTGATGNIAIAGTLGTNPGIGATVDGVQLQAYGANASTVVGTVGGSIAISGTANTSSSAASNGIELLTGQSSNTNSNNPAVQVVSRTGNVSLSGDNPGNANTGSTGVVLNGINYGKIAVGYDGTNAYSGATTVSGRSVVEANTYSGYLTLGGSGALTIQPTGNSFVSGAATGQGLDFNSSWTFGSNHSAITLGRDAGTASKIDTVAVSNALTAAGPIRLYGGSLNLNANLTSTLAGAGLLAKASGNITSAASVALQTNNGDLTLWSDSDASGAGAIALGNSNTFNSAGGATGQQSGGGRITLAGGLDGNADGIPDGAAVSGTTHGLAFGTSNASSTTVVSGGGDVLFRGRTSATSGTNHGVVATGALGVVSGQGAIDITGDSAASYGVELSNFASGNALTLNSAKASGTAIAITGTTTASSTHGLVFDNDAFENLLATGGGGIAITGTGTGSGYGVWLQNTNVLASSGAIVIDGGARGINVASGATGSRIGKSTTGVTSSSSDVVLTGNVVNLAATTTVDSTGMLKVQPSGGSFTSALTTTNLALASGLTGLTVGKPGNTAALAIGSAQTIAGPIDLYGGDIGIAGTLGATAGDILVRASGTLTVGAGAALQALNGDVTATTARWVNQSGASALVAGGSGHRWQVWSSNADPFNVSTGDVRGGLAFDYKQYGASYGASPVLGTGNGLLYSYQPTVSASLTGSVAKVYDGGTVATLASDNFGSLGSGVDGDQALVLGAPASGVYGSKDVGSGLTVTASGLAVASALSSSATGSKAVYGYALTSSSASAAIGSITPKALTATVAAPSKAYDGNATATPTLAIASGLVGSETLGVGGTASFNSKDVATANLVTVTGTTLSNGTNGGLAGNYSLGSGQTVAAAITPKALTATVAAPGKIYDGSASASPTLTLASGLVGSETLVAGGTAAFNSKDVATANLVTVASTTLADGTNGGLASNYSLAAGQTVASSITQKALTATVAAPAKVYDGTSAATPTFSIASGLVGSETVGASGAASFNSKDVATASLVTVTATSLADGTNGGLAGNYSLAAGQTVASTITPKALGATVAAPGKVYDGSVAASPTLTLVSGLVGSETLGVAGTASFNSKDVDTANLVTVGGATLSDGTNGGLAGNYSLAAGQTVASSITPKALTATVAAPGKVYDGDTSASPTLTLTSGLVGSETLGVSGVASFDSKDVATASLVTVTGTTLSNGGNGGLGTNYSLAAGQTVAAGITPKSLTATLTAPSKAYDGDTTADPTLTLVAGLVGGETLGVSGVASFNSKDVATANLVTVTAATLADGTNGGLAGNYSLAAGETVASTITPRALTATVAAPDKVYDGTRVASPTLTIASGLVGSETLGVTGTAAFDSKDVDTASVVTIASTALTNGANGGLAGNYSLASGETVAARITPKALTATVAAPSKVYDGSTSASPTLSITSGLVGSETLGVSGVASFNSKDVATANLVTVAAATLADGTNGGLAGNYSLAAVGTVASTITPRALTATVAAPTKVYDGSVAASSTLSIASGLVGSETLAVDGTASFNSKDVATANLVTVAATTLADGTNGGIAGNYTLAAGQTVASAITPKALTATVAAPDKVYDGTVTASPTLTLTSGLVGGETLGVAGAGAFNSRNVATANTVTVTATTLADGTNGGLAGNYTLAPGQAVAAVITPLTVGVTGVTASDKRYDAGTQATLVGSAGAALLAGDDAAVAGPAVARFADKNVGTGKAVGVTGYTLVGSDAGNYALLQPAGLTAAITPATLQLAGITAQDKVYDATPIAVLAGTATVAALGADQIGLAGSGSAAFGDRNVGSAKPVVAGGYTLTGADAANYVLASPAGLTASITPATLSLAGARVYDGSTSIAGEQLGASGVAGETFVVAGSGAAGNLVSRNVQAGQPLASVDGLALGAGNNGAVAGNYLPLAQATSRVDVTARPLTLGAAPVAKVYDGTTVADGSIAVIAGGLVSGDRLSGGQFVFADPNAGSAKVVTTSQVAVDDGNGGRNYSVAYAANQAVGRITPAALTVTANDDAKFVTRADGTGYNGVSYGGFVNGETAAVLGGAATVTRLGGVEAAGLQPGVLAPSGLSALNYEIRYANGSFTIVPAGQLLVRVANQNTIYGDGTAPGFLVTSAQYLDGNDVIKTLTPSAPVTGNTARYSDGAGGQATFTLGPVGGATSGAGLLKAGSYAVGATNVTETSVNFSDTLTVVGQLTVDPRAVRPVLVGGPGKVYDGTTSIGPLQFGLPGAVAGDQLQTDGVGTYGSRNAGTRVGYTVDQVALSGADAGNYVLLGGRSFSGNDGVIAPKPVTLTAPAATKVYDGQTGYGASAAELAALSTQLGVTGDAVRSIQIGFADKNVGIGKGITVAGAVVDDGNGGANYVLTLAGNSSGAITRLGSVTWTGGASGNWFDAANWAGGAVPDLRNVAQVVIPAGVRVAFDDAAVPAVVRGPVFVDGIGSAGALQMLGGELNVGPGGLRLADLAQSGGRLDVQGDTVLQTFAQSGGATTVAGRFGATQGYLQGPQGTLAVQGRVDIDAPLGDVVLGTLRAVGGLDVSTSDGAIRQATGTALTVPGATVLDAGRGDIALGNDGNDFVGAVSARGSKVTLGDMNALTLGTVTTSGDLGLSSNGLLDLGRSTVGGALTAASRGGDIVQQGPLVVHGATDLNAGAGAVRLADPSNALSGAVVVTASTTQLTGRVTMNDTATNDTPTNDTPTWLPPILSTTFVSPAPAATPAPARAMGLELHVAMMWLDPRSQRFAYTLPPEMIERVRRSGVLPVMSQADGRPLPEWLHFDAETMSLSAEQMPDGQLPMSLALWTQGERLLIRLASAAP